MRLRIRLLVFFVLLTLIFIICRLVDFLQLFFEHSGVPISQANVALEYSTAAPNSRQQHIPKIIHQVYHDWQDKSMPADWDELRQTCIHLNEGWEYKLWTKTASRDFIETHYPWFLDTYDGYVFPIQRVDTIRYFAILHFGGIYLDLDNGCLETLIPLLYYPTWTTDGGRGALSNNIIGSQPNHPFWKLLTESLIPYNYNYFFPYITISYASGQWFETAIWQDYHRTVTEENRLHRIMMDNRPGTEPWVFFSQGQGGSWGNWDNDVFIWIGDHLILMALGLAGSLGLLGWMVKRCWAKRAGSEEWNKDMMVVKNPFEIYP